MEITVTGCKDCPLYYSGDGQEMCEHPNAMYEFGLWESGTFTKLPFEGPEGLYRLETEKGTYSVSLAKRQPPINTDEDCNPVTPEWCPLNQESITISKTNS